MQEGGCSAELKGREVGEKGLQGSGRKKGLEVQSRASHQQRPRPALHASQDNPGLDCGPLICTMRGWTWRSLGCLPTEGVQDPVPLPGCVSEGLWAVGAQREALQEQGAQGWELGGEKSSHPLKMIYKCPKSTRKTLQPHH